MSYGHRGRVWRYHTHFSGFSTHEIQFLQILTTKRSCEGIHIYIYVYIIYVYIIYVYIIYVYIIYVYIIYVYIIYVYIYTHMYILYMYIYMYILYMYIYILRRMTSSYICDG